MPPVSDVYRNIFDSASEGLIIVDMKTGRVVEANPAAVAMHGYARAKFIGLAPAVYLHPDSQPLFALDVENVRPGAVFETHAVHIRRDQSAFHVEAHRTALIYQDRPCLLSVIRDVSQRVQAEELLHHQVETQAREQAILLEVSQTLASALELQPGLILDQLRVIIDYAHAGLFALADSQLVALAMRGSHPLEQTVPFCIHLNGPETLMKLFNGNSPVRIADVWGTVPAAQFLRSLLDNQSAMLLTGMQSWMWVPVAVKGRLIGCVGVAHGQPDYFTAHHADLALNVANQAAITMINAELYEHAQALAVLRERQRLAQELHDAVNQSLFSAGLIAEVLPRLWELDQEAGRRSLEDLRRLTRGALAEMRMLLVELRPSALTDTDLGDLLRLLGNALMGRANVPVTVTVAGEGDLPAEVQVTFYRLCQEALNNIAKHAEATGVTIQLHHAPETGITEMRLRDDGRGFDPDQIPAGHYGLSIMRERAEAVGAGLSVTSQPGRGTEVTLRWPKASAPRVK